MPTATAWAARATGFRSPNLAASITAMAMRLRSKQWSSPISEFAGSTPSAASVQCQHQTCSTFRTRAKVHFAKVMNLGPPPHGGSFEIGGSSKTITRRCIRHSMAQVCSTFHDRDPDIAHPNQTPVRARSQAARRRNGSCVASGLARGCARYFAGYRTATLREPR